LALIATWLVGSALHQSLSERHRSLEKARQTQQNVIEGLQGRLDQAQKTTQTMQQQAELQRSQLADSKAEFDRLRGQLTELQQVQALSAQEQLAQETERADTLRRSFEAQLLERERLIEELGMRVARAEDGMREMQLQFDVLAQAAQEWRDQAAAPSGQPQPTLPQEAAWHALLPRLKDENPSVRWQTIDELSRTGDPAVLEHVVMALADTDLFVRMRAASALGELKLEQALPAILDAMGDAEPMVREAACQSLKLLTGRDPRFDPSASDLEREKRLRALREALLSGPSGGSGAAPSAPQKP
jgi:HEAT repeat protein